jgi:hypothetical protein
MNRKSDVHERMLVHLSAIYQEIAAIRKLAETEKDFVFDANWADVGTVAHVAAQLTEIRKFWDVTPDQDD